MFFQKKINKTPIVVDIGSNEIKVIKYNYDEKVNNIDIVGYGNFNTPKNCILNGVIKESTPISEAIRSAYIEARNKDDEEDLVIGLSGIMIDIEKKVINIKRPKPESKISTKEWNAILEGIESEMDKQEYKSNILHNIQMELFQSSIENINIDDRKTFTPIGEIGREISIDLFNAYYPEENAIMLSKISEDLNMPIEAIFHSSYGVGQILIDNHPKNNPSMILVDIGSTHTDVTILNEGSIDKVRSFSIGGDVFTAKLSKELEVSFDEAEDLKKEYSDAKLPKKITEKITDMLKSERELLLEGINIVLNDLPPTYILPDHIVLFGGGSLLLGIKEMVEYSNWYKKMKFTQRPKVSIFYPKILSHIIDNTNRDINTPSITPLLGLIHLEISKNRFKY